MPQDDDDLEGAILDDNIRRELRDARKQRAQYEKQLHRAAEAEMRAAMAEAQIPRDGLGALFRDAYKGDADPDAILAKAKEYGLFEEKPPPPATAGSEDQSAIMAELARLQAAQGTVSGGGPPQPDAGQSFYAELAALPDKQPSSRAGQQAVMELVDKYQREHPEMGIYTKGTR